MSTSVGTITRLAFVTLIAMTIAIAPMRGALAQDAPPAHKKHHKRTTVTSTTTTTTTAEDIQQKRIDDLTKQLQDMQKQQADLMGQLKDLKTQMVMTAPAAPANAPSPAAAPSPVTIGEHVAVVEGDLAQTKKDLATNLGVSIHGLVDASYEHNFNQPNGETNNLRAWDNNDGFQLTQGNLHVEKDGTVGFVTDINVGQVAESINSASHFSNSPPDAFSGRWIDPTQYYLTYTIPVGSGISLQAGRFVTLLGEEVIPTYTNQNYNETRGFVFNNGEPLTHTGIRASYTYNEYVAVTGGLNNGWDNPGNSNNGGPNYEGELTLNNKDKSLALVLNGIWGPNQIGHSNSNRGAIDPIVTWKPPFVPNLTLATEYLYGSESGHVINGHSATWQGVAQYIVYDWNAWEFATRGEWFDDEDGSRTGVHQDLWEGTQTITYKVPDVTGLLVRGEYRHDQSNHHSFGDNDFVTPVVGQRLWKGQDTLLGALIYAF
jgi:putative OmpL-like beta-barrel porin-2